MSHDYVTVYKGVIGSHLYGTNRADSDVDYLEIILPKKEDIFGLGDRDRSLKHQVSDTLDVQTHTVNKFMRLVCKGNAYAVETLFIRREWMDILGCVSTPEFDWLIARPLEILQLSKVVAGHVGFAIGQYKKMVTCNPNMGERRREMAAQYGYDVKYAAHALRLVWQVKDLLSAGTFHFPMSTARAAVIDEIRGGKIALGVVEKLFNAELNDVDTMSKNPCPVDDSDKTEEINRRLFQFYTNPKVMGYVIHGNTNSSVASVPV